MLQALPVLFGVTLASFFLIHLVPGDPVRVMIGPKATAESVRVVRHDLGLDKPLAEQYVNFLGGAVRFDFGTSIIQRTDVNGLILERLPVTLELIGFAVVIALILAIPLGVVAALRRGRFVDHTIRIASTVAFAMPAFWLGLVLVQLFSIHLGWFPTSGAGEPGLDRLRHLFLPALTIGLFLAPILLRSLRSDVLETLSAEHVEAARSRGLSKPRVTTRHVLRNSLISTVTVLGVNVGFLLSGTVVIEAVYALPGLGTLLVNSIVARDFPLVQGLVVVFAVAVIVVNLLTDLAYAALDPRVRL
jgi:peptide/nickel transport system permease protein